MKKKRFVKNPVQKNWNCPCWDKLIKAVKSAFENLAILRSFFPMHTLFILFVYYY